MGDAAESRTHTPIYLITHPRSCSNLLVRILALDEQPNVCSAAFGGGYFFFPTFMQTMTAEIWAKNIEAIPEEKVAKWRESLQSDANIFGQHVGNANSEGKQVIVKEHAMFMTNPVTMTNHLYGAGSTKQSMWLADPRPAVGGDTSKSSAEEDRSNAITGSNITVLPDDFLESWKPTFLIRHPALAFPSFFRASRDIRSGKHPEEEWMRMTMTMRWNRSVYEWYAQKCQAKAQSQNGGAHHDNVQWPVVVEADDILSDPRVVLRFSEILGLDSSKLRFSWDQANEEKLSSIPEHGQRMLSSLLSSTGIDKSKSAENLSIDAEAKKWCEEFGEEQAAKVGKLVRAAMPDYEFLKSKRLRPATQ